jgi:hypothetical protein
MQYLYRTSVALHASSLGTNPVQSYTGITDPPPGAVFILRLTTNKHHGLM